VKAISWKEHIHNDIGNTFCRKEEKLRGEEERRRE
jgi:hypothetical protein